MTGRAAASRYARALFDVARAERLDLPRVEQELAAFSGLMTGNDALMRALTNPAIPAARKRAVIEQLIAHASALLPPVSKLLLMLADRDRLALLPDIADVFRTRLLDHLKIVRAEVVTAIQLPADRMTAIQQGLARATGRQVQLDTRVDPGILGGAVARIGSTVYDGSVTRQLERMHETLVNAE